MGSHRKSIARKEELRLFWLKVGRPNGTPPRPRDTFPPRPRSYVPRHLEITFVPVVERKK